MKVLLSRATTDAGCISLKRSIDYLSKQVKAIEIRIQELIFDDTSMQKEL
jgi:transposase